MATRFEILIALTLACGLPMMAHAANDWRSSKTPPPVIETPASPAFTTYTLPAGSTFHVLLQTPVTTTSNQINDPVDAEMVQNVYLGEHLLVSKDDHVHGKITMLLGPIQGRNAVLEIRFTDLLLHNGEDLPINAFVATGRDDHRWGGEVTQGTKPDTVVHSIWGIGQYKQLVWRGPRAMGQQVELKPGEYWTIVLDAPVNIVLPKDSTDTNP